MSETGGTDGRKGAPSSSFQDRLLGNNELADLLGEYQPPAPKEVPDDGATTEAADATRKNAEKTLGKPPEKKK